MKIEEVISSAVMCVVSGLVLIGFTIAWFTDMSAGATVTGLEMVAAKMGDVKVALEPGGKDVSELEEPACYAEIDFVKYLDMDENGQKELAPGTCGRVTFYVTPTHSSVEACDIVPVVRITQDENTWYPDQAKLKKIVDADDNGSDETDGESGNSDDTGDESGDGNSDGEDTVTLEGLYDIVQEHIEFYADEEMTVKVTADNPIELTWPIEDENLETDNIGEQKVVIYWKWHYEYPFTAEETAKLTDAEEEEYIDAYDEEDMKIGNHISKMKFYFAFTVR